MTVLNFFAVGLHHHIGFVRIFTFCPITNCMNIKNQIVLESQRIQKLHLHFHTEANRLTNTYAQKLQKSPKPKIVHPVFTCSCVQILLAGRNGAIDLLCWKDYSAKIMTKCSLSQSKIKQPKE